MAKKDEKKSKAKRHHISDEERGERFGKRMERLGKKFGKKMGKQGKDFGEEVAELGEKFEGDRRQSEERWERKEWRFGTFGLIWPVVGSVFTLVVLALCIWVLDFINLSLKSYFIFQVSSFLLGNLYLFFAFSLFLGYARYFRRRARRVYWLISPIVNALGVVFLVWISIFMLNLANFYVGSSFIELIANFLRLNFAGIFLVFLALGYGFEFIKRILLEY